MNSGVPATPREEKPFRGEAKSEDYNKFTRRTFFDISNLYNIANKLEEDLNFAIETNRVTDVFIQMKLAEQDRLIREMEIEKASLNNAIKQFVMAKDMLPDETSKTPASTDRHHNLVTISSTGSPVSKLYLTDTFTGEIILPNVLNAVVDPPADNAIIKDTNIFDSIKGGFAFWRRKVTKRASEYIPSVSAQVIIDLPEEIITNRNVNMINIAPYPCGMVDIANIEYNVDGSWNVIPGFVPMSNAKDMVLYFASIAIKQLRITFKQRNFIIEGENKQFYLGAKRIGVYSANYKTENGDLLIPIELKGSGRRAINTITPLFANAGALTDTTTEKRSVFNYAIYEVDDQGNLIFTRNTLPIYVNSNNIIIKASLNADPNNKAIPALEAVELDYSITGVP